MITGKPILKSRLLLQAVCITAGGLLFTFCQTAKRNGDVVAWVNGTQITQEEFAFYISDCRPGVYNHFHSTYGIDDNPDFWKTKYGNERPAEMAKACALKRITADRIVLADAVGQGLLDSISFSSFLAGLETENQRRRDAIHAKAVVYGPMQWDAHTYYQYRQSNLEIGLKRIMETDPSVVPESRLYAAFDSLKSTMFVTDSLRFLKVSIATVASGSRENARRLLGRFMLCLDSANDFAQCKSCAGTHTQPALHVSEFTLGKDRHDGDGEAGSDGFGDLRGLTPGQTMEVIDDQDSASLIRCLEKFSGFKPFESAKPHIRRLLIDREFDRRVTEEIRRARVDINHRVFDSFFPQ